MREKDIAIAMSWLLFSIYKPKSKFSIPRPEFGIVESLNK